MAKTTKKEIKKKESPIYMVDITNNPAIDGNNEIGFGSSIEEAYNECKESNGPERTFYAYKVVPLGEVKEKIEIVK